MSREKRKFTPEERLSLVQEASREGFTQTCRNYNIGPSLMNRWKQRYLEQGFSGLKAMN